MVSQPAKLQDARVTGRERTTMRKILGDQEDPLGLLDDEVDIRVFETGSDKLFSVEVERKFYGLSFMNLLSRTSPENFGFGDGTKNAILNDWRDYDKRRRQLHQEGLGEDWTEFEYRRNAFIRALMYNDQRLNHLRPKLLTREQSIAMLRDFMLRNTGRKSAAFLPGIYTPYRGWLQEKGIYHSRNKLRKWSNQYRSVVIEKWTEDIPDALLKGIMESGALGFKALVLDGHNTRTYVVDRNEYSAEPLGNNSFKISHNGSWITVDLSQNQPKETGRYIAYALVPLIVWTRSEETGKRNYLRQKDAAGLSTDPRVDTSLGLIVATYLSPQERASLSHQLGLSAHAYEKSGYRKILDKQTMREAQVPVLVSMFRHIILGGPVFRGVERYVA